MMNMTQEQIIDVESQEVVEEPTEKSKEQRQMEQAQFNLIKKMIKEKRKYYKSNLFAIKKLDSTK